MNVFICTSHNTNVVGLINIIIITNAVSTHYGLLVMQYLIEQIVCLLEHKRKRDRDEVGY